MASAAHNVFTRVNREIWLLTAQAGDRRGGLIATFVNSASIVPGLPRVLVGVGRGHFTWQLVEASGAFALHLLGESNLDWVWRFGMTSGRDGDKFAGLSVAAAPVTGSPILEGGLGWLDCRVEDRFDIGDRTVYVAEVLEAGGHREGPALTEQSVLQRATSEQRVELKRQRQADALVDAEAIRAWRAERTDHR